MCLIRLRFENKEIYSTDARSISGFCEKIRNVVGDERQNTKAEAPLGFAFRGG